MSEKRVLCVGLTCLDIVTNVAAYPDEDTDQRAVAQSWRRGGNASNNCTAMAQLGTAVEFFGSMSCHEEDVGRKFCEQDMDQCNIKYSNCVRNNCLLPMSVILINDQNGSRTIVHHRGAMPEITLEDFQKLNLNDYSWIHFEGRTKSGERPHVTQILKYLQQEKSKFNFKVSVELEKTYEGMSDLGILADVVFVSKEFSQYCGSNTPESMIKEFRSRLQENSLLICPWGEKGAFASDNQNVYKSPPFPPKKVIDTLGAGDSFVGSTIHMLNKGESLESAITFGCKYAGAKCGQVGLKNIRF